MRLLDLFSGAGGCAVGYHRAGFTDITGVDNRPMPRYPFRFIQADALEFLAQVQPGEYDLIHASPPCQAYTPLGALHPHKTYPDLVAATREALERLGTPYVIENVPAAPLRDPITLCGGMFGLRTYRHRRFESSAAIAPPTHPAHVARTATKQRRARWAEGWNVSITGDVGTYLAQEAMGIDWMTGNELCQAIPPAFTEWIGAQMLRHLPLTPAETEACR